MASAPKRWWGIYLLWRRDRWYRIELNSPDPNPMSKSLIEECPPSVYVIGAIFVLALLIVGIRTAYSVSQDFEDAKCEPLQDMPAAQRNELQRQICPDWKPKA